MEEVDVGEQHSVSAHGKKGTFPGKGQLSASSRLGDTTHRATDRKLPISQKRIMKLDFPESAPWLLSNQVHNQHHPLICPVPPPPMCIPPPGSQAHLPPPQYSTTSCMPFKPAALILPPPPPPRAYLHKLLMCRRLSCTLLLFPSPASPRWFVENPGGKSSISTFSTLTLHAQNVAPTVRVVDSGNDSLA